jgi:hypothetical protein
VDKPHSEAVHKKEEVAIYAPPPQPKPKLFLSSPFCEAALVKGSLKTLIALPRYIDVMEWVAVNSRHNL